MQIDFPYQPFVIIGTARTGSTMLWSYLNSHPDVLCLRGAYGSTNKVNFGKFYLDLPEECYSKELITLRNNSSVRFLNEFIFKSYPRPYKAIGFKYFYDHDRHLRNKNELLQYFSQNKRIKFIHLKRDDLLATLFSYKRARAQNQWNADDSNFRTCISISECYSFFDLINKQQIRFDKLFGQRSLSISYENMVHQPNTTLSNVQQFLGLQPKQLKTETTRNREVKLADFVTNYSELRQYFQSTRHGHYFYH